MFPITRTSCIAAGFRLSFGSIVLSASPFAISAALAQQAAAPAAELDAITVQGQASQKKKAAQAKSKATAKAVAKAAAQPAPVAAADAPAANVEPPSGTGKATKPGLNLDNPNTGGSRLNLTPLQTPASVEIIPGDTARERGQTTIVDAVTQNATGITSNSSQGNGGTSMASRGFAGHGSVATLYDGTKLYVTAGTVTFPFNSWSADRIEVLRGPGSVLYGEGAIGGVVNVVPKKATDTFFNEAEVSIGTDWTRRLSLGSGGPINDKLSYRFDVTGEQSNDWVDDGEFKNAALSGAFRYKATPGLVFTLSNDYGYQEPMKYWGTPLIDGKIDRRIRFKNFNVEDAEIKYRDNWTQFKTEWSVNDAITLRNTAYRLTTDRHWKNAETYTYNAGTGLVARNGYTEIVHDEEQIGNRFYATLRHRTFGLPMQTVVGFDINRVDLTYTSNFSRGEIDPTVFIDPFSDFDGGSFDIATRARPAFTADMLQYSLFAEHRIELTKQLSLIGGLRLDRPDIERFNLVNNTQVFDRDFSELTWRAGAVYELLPGLAFYGQYATALDPTGSAILSMNAAQSNFELTKGRQIEAGVKQSVWGGRGEWTFAAYDIVKTDILVPQGMGVFLQVGQQSSQGVEASLALQLSQALRVEGNVALLRAQYDEFGDFTGNQPTDVPEKVGNLWVNYAFAPRWQARAGVQYVGERYADEGNEVALDKYVIVNAGLDYQVTDSSTLSLRGYNLFDEVYGVTSSYGADWVLGRPRSADLTYRIKF